LKKIVFFNQVLKVIEMLWIGHQPPGVVIVVLMALATENSEVILDI
jgi:hypothetical protein